MIFKRSKGGKPFGVILSKDEQKALDQEINRQLLQADREFEMDRDASILWMLHIHFGFGAGRLKKAWKAFYSAAAELRDYYQLDREDGGWICRQKLKELGCDLEKWYEEGKD